MEESLQEFWRGFWLCLVGSLLCGALTFVLIRRRHLWLRFLDAEEAFWLRFGIPKSKGGLRALAESRFFTLSFAFFTIVLFAMAALNVYAHFHIKK
jgi:hypothetical protein